MFRARKPGVLQRSVRARNHQVEVIEIANPESFYIVLTCLFSRTWLITCVYECVNQVDAVMNMLFQIADRLQDNPIIISLTSTGWTAAALAILHYYSMFVLVGSMVIVDLRVLGVLGRSYDTGDLARRIFPWVWFSLGVNLISGFIMFAGDATAYLPTWSFQLKVAVVLLAIVFGLLVQWRIPRWEASPVPRAEAKVVAIVSLLLWIGAILMGVEVPAISGIG